MKIIKGQEINKYIDQLGHFRIKIFKEFPYLYEGDLQYERKYLSRYVKSPGSILILMLDKKGIIGACTGIPLKDEDEEFIKPFLGNNIEEIFYIGELVIRADSRAKGLGTKLILQMLDLIDKSKFKMVCFYTVDRGQNHPLQPPAYKSPEILWEKFNFVKDQKKLVYYHWKDIGDLIETNKPMNVWTKKL